MGGKTLWEKDKLLIRSNLSISHSVFPVSFQGFKIVIATRFIPLSLLSIFSTMVMYESSQWERNKAEYCLKEFQESMDRLTGLHDVTEIMLKTALNTTQSINQCKVNYYQLYFSLQTYLLYSRAFLISSSTTEDSGNFSFLGGPFFSPVQTITSTIQRH